MDEGKRNFLLLVIITMNVSLSFDRKIFDKWLKNKILFKNKVFKEKLS